VSAARLVLLLRESVAAAEPVCTACLWADSEGRPRLRGEQLLCAREVASPAGGHRYRCRMGFQIAQVQM
jgi:hypothetical protein